MFVIKILVFNVSQPDIYWYKKRLPLVFFVVDLNAIFQLVSRCTNNISNDFIALYSASPMSLLPKNMSLIRGTLDAWISKISSVQRRRKAKTITHLDKTFATLRRFHIRILWPHDKITSNENIPVSIVAFYHVTGFKTWLFVVFSFFFFSKLRTIDWRLSNLNSFKYQLFCIWFSLVLNYCSVNTSPRTTQGKRLLNGLV